MLEKFNTEIAKNRTRKALILLISLILILALFRLLHYHQSQRKIISEYKNTNIRERLITNNKVAQMNKPYKINNGIVYVPLLELCNNFGTKIEYKFLPFGEVEVKYKKYTYYLKRGSNEVRFAKNKDVLKMDGVMEYMEDTIYVPLDFIYKVLDVNVVQSSDRTVYMDNYPKKFNYSWVGENRYIAHAMGGVDGNSYTNSKQAMISSYKRGLRVFEADMSMSSDNELILLHSYDRQGLSELALPLSWANTKPTKKEFLSEKILGKYDTLALDNVVEFMKEHKDVYLVVDLKTNDIKSVEQAYKKLVDTFKKIDPSSLNRVIPQIYYEEMYKPVMNIYDFKSMIFTTYRLEELEVNRIVDFSYEHGIKIVAANKFKFSADLTKKLVDRDISLYMYTYNDQNKVNSLRNSYVSGFYTDFLPKEVINRDANGKVVVKK